MKVSVSRASEFCSTYSLKPLLLRLHNRHLARTLAVCFTARSVKEHSKASNERCQKQNATE